MRLVLSFLLALVAVPGMSWAGPFDDAAAAYDRKDYATTLRLMRPLAAQGDKHAQFNLGRMYFKGEGVAKDYVRAHMWFNLAAAKGDAGSVKNRDFVATLLTPQQAAEAQKLARECQARNFKECD